MTRPSTPSAVLVPYTALRPETFHALVSLPRRVTWARLETVTDYFDLLAAAWRMGAAITVVEQDMLPTPDQLDALDACPEPWCGFAYNMTSGYHASLGCTRFSANLVAAEPDLFAAVATYEHPYVPARHYIWLADRIEWELAKRGYTQHTHWPPVAHLNPRHAIPTEQARGWCDWPACQVPHAYRG